jgi:hypothetical protein
MRFGEDREARRLTKWSWSVAMGKPRFIAPFFYRLAPASPYLTTADRRRHGRTAVHTQCANCGPHPDFVRGLVCPRITARLRAAKL